MSRIKLIALSVFAMFAVGAISAATASAEFTAGTACEGETITTICIEPTVGAGLKEATGSEEFKVKLEEGVESLLEVASLSLHIVCKEAKGTGTLSQASPLVSAPTIAKATLDFTECTILEPLAAKCKVKEPIKTELLIGEFLASEPRHIELKPEAGETKPFAQITITNVKECPTTVVGINPIKGKVLALFLEAAETTDAVVQLLMFTHEETSETKLEFGTNPATFESELELEFTKKWLWDTRLA
jgi:hypothetical protein